jgi:hypothetical protein
MLTEFEWRNRDQIMHAPELRGVLLCELSDLSGTRLDTPKY